MVYETKLAHKTNTRKILGNISIIMIIISRTASFGGTRFCPDNIAHQYCLAKIKINYWYNPFVSVSRKMFFFTKVMGCLIQLKCVCGI